MFWANAKRRKIVDCYIQWCQVPHRLIMINWTGLNRLRGSERNQNAIAIVPLSSLVHRAAEDRVCRRWLVHLRAGRNIETHSHIVVTSSSGPGYVQKIIHIWCIHIYILSGYCWASSLNTSHLALLPILSPCVKHPDESTSKTTNIESKYI